jgi:integrase
MDLRVSVNTFEVTFHEQAEVWLDSLKTRKRKPVSQATLHAFGSYVRRLTPMIGQTKLADINNGALRQLVRRLDKESSLSPKTIAELVSTVKQIVTSLVDESTGEPLLKREWSARFIDCPTIANQKQPCATREDVERCLKESSSDQEKVLYAVLAGSGLRIAEALAIHVAGREDQTSWSPETQAIRARSSIFNGHETPRLKTLAARRTVDLDAGLSDLIARYVESNVIQPGGYLFQARSGRPMHLKTARQRLAKHNISGFHSFRRFFISRRRSIGFPEFLLRSIVGHSGRSITDLYDKSADDEAYRKHWAKEAGLGFALPELRKSGAPPPQSSEVVVSTAESPALAKAHSVVEAVPEVLPYHASDDDLPAELFEMAAEQSEHE